MVRPPFFCFVLKSVCTPFSVIIALTTVLYAVGEYPYSTDNTSNLVHGWTTPSRTQPRIFTRFTTTTLQFPVLQHVFAMFQTLSLT